MTFFFEQIPDDRVEPRSNNWTNVRLGLANPDLQKSAVMVAEGRIRTSACRWICISLSDPEMSKITGKACVPSVRLATVWSKDWIVVSSRPSSVGITLPRAPRTTAKLTKKWEEGIMATAERIIG